ncbi:jg23876 [Pararge aegeria aegeria]|uniref:Jg23876 protein n=1 Tax=Pararge aegeria aegeria TaxID=348720 RepID=A0A8S4RN02_9NEOP|nr:jg23876 [Pararge aegeria aegeria]
MCEVFWPRRDLPAQTYGIPIGAHAKLPDETKRHRPPVLNQKIYSPKCLKTILSKLASCWLDKSSANSTKRVTKRKWRKKPLLMNTEMKPQRDLKLAVKAKNILEARMRASWRSIQSLPTNCKMCRLKVREVVSKSDKDCVQCSLLFMLYLSLNL